MAYSAGFVTNSDLERCDTTGWTRDRLPMAHAWTHSERCGGLDSPAYLSALCKYLYYVNIMEKSFICFDSMFVEHADSVIASTKSFVTSFIDYKDKRKSLTMLGFLTL